MYYLRKQNQSFGSCLSMHLCGAVDLHYRYIIFALLINTTNTSLNELHPCMLSQIQCTTNGPHMSVTFSVSITDGRGG